MPGVLPSFASCCCAEASDSNQFTQSTSTDEAVVAISTQSVLRKESPRSNLTAFQDSIPFSARSLSPEEKEGEKARLQQLVNSFAKKAVKGCPCLYLKESTGERVATQYRIDKSLEYLIVVSSQDSQRAEVTCPIGAIQDIYSLVEDGEGCFPTEVVSKLKPEEQNLLLMVVYRNGQSKMFRFCLLEENPESRDTFLECLRILCIYAQSSPAATEEALRNADNKGVTALTNG